MIICLHIAVFAKAPIPGHVKTRLIPLLGEEGAAAVHRQMLLHALTIACDAARGNVSLWIDGDPDHAFLAECSRRFNVAPLPQCGADLGERMENCLRTGLQRHPAVLLIGSDSPVLRVQDLLAAADGLQRGATMVFTPAEDGGYVLVGQRQGIDATGYAFRGIAWGGETVMQQTRENLRAQGWQQDREWIELPKQWDVDTPTDYARAISEGLIAVPK